MVEDNLDKRPRLGPALARAQSALGKEEGEKMREARRVLRDAYGRALQIITGQITLLPADIDNHDTLDDMIGRFALRNAGVGVAHSVGIQAVEQSLDQPE